MAPSQPAPWTGPAAPPTGAVEPVAPVAPRAVRATGAAVPVAEYVEYRGAQAVGVWSGAIGVRFLGGSLGTFLNRSFSFISYSIDDRGMTMNSYFRW